MIEIFKCRRSSLALIGMVILGVAMWSGTDTSMAIASICMGVAGSNCIQKYKEAEARARSGQPEKSVLK